MDPVLERKLLIAEYQQLSSILRESGVEVPEVDLDTVSLADLSAIVRRFRLMARTPH